MVLLLTCKEYRSKVLGEWETLAAFVCKLQSQHTATQLHQFRCAHRHERRVSPSTETYMNSPTPIYTASKFAFLSCSCYQLYQSLCIEHLSRLRKKNSLQPNHVFISNGPRQGQQKAVYTPMHIIEAILPPWTRRAPVFLAPCLRHRTP